MCRSWGTAANVRDLTLISRLPIVWSMGTRGRTVGNKTDKSHMNSRIWQHALTVIALIAAGCGSSSDATAPPPPPTQIFGLSTGPNSCSGGMAGDFACSGLSLRKRVSNGAMGGGDGNDIWGWVDALTGNEYALMGLTDRKSVV